MFFGTRISHGSFTRDFLNTNHTNHTNNLLHTDLTRILVRSVALTVFEHESHEFNTDF